MLLRVIPKLELRWTKVILGRFPKGSLGVRLAAVALICQEMSIPNDGFFKVPLEHCQGHQSETPKSTKHTLLQGTSRNYQLSIATMIPPIPLKQKKSTVTIPNTNTSPLKNGAFCQKDRLPTELLDQGHRHPQDTATHGEPELRIGAKNKETGKPKPGPRFPKTTDMFYGDIKLMDLFPLWIVGQCRWTWIDLCGYVNINTYKS